MQDEIVLVAVLLLPENHGNAAKEYKHGKRQQFSDRGSEHRRFPRGRSVSMVACNYSVYFFARFFATINSIGYTKSECYILGAAGKSRGWKLQGVMRDAVGLKRGAAGVLRGYFQKLS
jgi:hypothetical protein